MATGDVGYWLGSDGTPTNNISLCLSQDLPTTLPSGGTKLKMNGRYVDGYNGSAYFPGTFKAISLTSEYDLSGVMFQVTGQIGAGRTVTSDIFPGPSGSSGNPATVSSVPAGEGGTIQYSYNAKKYPLYFSSVQFIEAVSGNIPSSSTISAGTFIPTPATQTVYVGYTNWQPVEQSVAFFQYLLYTLPQQNPILLPNNQFVSYSLQYTNDTVYNPGQTPTLTEYTFVIPAQDAKGGLPISTQNIVNNNNLFQSSNAAKDPFVYLIGGTSNFNPFTYVRLAFKTSDGTYAGSGSMTSNASVGGLNYTLLQVGGI